MEELLNKLIEKGWKPFGIAYYCSFDVKEEIKILLGPFGGGEYLLHRTLSLRELVSKESGLWQFVCEKVMVKEHTSLDKEMRWRKYRPYDAERENKYMYNTYQYRLLESSLIDESKLEQFLLDNINV